MRFARAHLFNLTALLMIVLCLALASCDQPNPPPKIEKTPQPRPDSQQILRILDQGNDGLQLNSLDPATAYYRAELQITQLVFPSLVTLDTHEQPVDWAAASHEVSSDGLTYTFHLRPNLRWSDGTPIDATTFAYSINRGLDPCLHSYSSFFLYLSAIKGSEQFYNEPCPLNASSASASLIGASLLTPDPLTLRILLDHPSGGFLAALTYPPAYAVAKHLVEKYRFSDEWIDHITENGGFGGNLYKLTRLDNAGHITLTRNEAFWGGAKPRIRTIEYTFDNTSQLAWSDYTGGHGDVTFPPTQEFDAARAGKGFHQTPTLLVYYFRPNWRVPPLDDERLREAFSLALDRKALVDTAFNGASQPTIHIIPEGVNGYNKDLRDADGRSGDAALTADKEKAGALWQSYVHDKCHGDPEQCSTIYFMPLGYVSAGVKLAIQMWEEAMPGVRVEAYHVDGVLEVDWQKKVPFSDLGWYADYPDPQQLVEPLIHTGARDNLTGVSLPAVDALLDAAASNQDQAGRLAQYQQAEQLAVSQAAVIPISQGLLSWVATPALVGGWAYTSAESVPLSAWQSAYLAKSA
jgi:oligopeptide transport system substrate-binding protein